jgi:hypothetical protein
MLTIPNNKVKLILQDEYLESINKILPEIEKEGFFIDKIDYTMGYVYGRAEYPERFKQFKFIKGYDS